MGVSQWLIQNFRSGGGGEGGLEAHSFGNKGGSPEWKENFRNPPNGTP